MLRTNRQIHAEAAPIFWSRNTFCFLSGYEVIVAFKDILRHQYRGCVSEICLMSPANDGAPLHVSLDGSNPGDICPTNWPLFWQTVSKCFSLRRLQVSPDVVFPNIEEVHRVAVERPKLESDLVTLIPFFKRGQRPEEYPFEIDSQMHRYAMYGEARHGVHSFERMMQNNKELKPVAWDWDHLASVCDFDASEINFVIREQFLDSWWGGRFTSRYTTSDDDEFWPFYFDLGSGSIHKEATKVLVILENGRQYTVRFYGLPPSCRQASQATKMFALEKKQRAINGMTDAQRELKNKSRRLRKAKKQKLEVERQAIREQSSLLPDPNSKWVKPEILEKQEKKSAMEEMIKSQKDNAEMRRKERKRVRVRYENIKDTCDFGMHSYP
ncbi:ribosomal protein l32 [Colletotrichum incanum]|uniref:Ribosomal protein l32 n=1 Tax=Colletotrichum incanum TaxID=1573173 RepID=A0A161VXN2_COLIC|nr:ribosomal protein l32 [Colletotrichum incanum]